MSGGVLMPGGTCPVGINAWGVCSGWWGGLMPASTCSVRVLMFQLVG